MSLYPLSSMAETFMQILRSRLGISPSPIEYIEQDSWAKHYIPEYIPADSSSVIISPGDDCEGGVLYESHRRGVLKTSPVRRRDALVARSPLECVSHTDWFTDLPNDGGHSEQDKALLEQIERMKKIEEKKQEKLKNEKTVVEPKSVRSQRTGSVRSQKSETVAAPSGPKRKNEKSFSMDADGKIVYLN